MEFSMKNSMEKSIEFHGIPWNFPWNFMGISWKNPSNVYEKNPWNFPWNSMELLHGIFMEFHGIS
jgi:hypothetical protein